MSPELGAPTSGEMARGFLLILVIVGAMAVPLALALWRLQRRLRYRHLRLPGADRQALLAQVNAQLSRVGFVAGRAEGSTVRFDPNRFRQLLGLHPVQLVFDRPSSARLTAPHGTMRRIAHAFQGAVEEPYAGPASPVLGRLVRVSVAVLGALALGLSAVAYVHARGSPRRGTGPASELDVTRTLTITAEQARTGARVELALPDTSMPLGVTIEPGTTEGQRLVFEGLGKSSPKDGRAGTLFVIVHVR